MEVQHYCSICNKLLEKPLYCGRCKKQCYCSVECQHKSWPIHKLKCAPHININKKYVKRLLNNEFILLIIWRMIKHSKRLADENFIMIEEETLEDASCMTIFPQYLSKDRMINARRGHEVYNENYIVSYRIIDKVLNINETLCLTFGFEGISEHPNIDMIDQQITTKIGRWNKKYPLIIIYNEQKYVVSYMKKQILTINI